MTLSDILKLIRKHLILMIALPLACAVLTAAYAWLLMPNEYTATTTMYVLSRNGDNGEGTTLTNNDLTASQMLANDVAALAKSSRVQESAAKALGMDSISGYLISVESSTSTRLITLSVTGESPQSAANIANKIGETVDNVAREVMDVQSVNIIDSASVPNSPSGPQRLLYTFLAFLTGIFVALAIMLLRDMLDTRINDPDEIAELLPIPVIGRIPKL